MNQKHTIINQILFTAIISAILPTAHASELKDDESVIVFPTLALPTAGGGWTLNIHAWVFEPERDSLLRRGLLVTFADVLDIENEDGRDNEIFQSRAAWFLVDNERNKEITLRIDNRTVTLEPTSASGHIQQSLTISQQRMSVWTQDHTFSTLPMKVIPPDDDDRQFTGIIHIPNPQGLIVISDIDDTLKHSSVHDKRELLASTFTKPFKAVDGMATRYQHWYKRGATFIYLSSSPWQLYPLLSSFMMQAGFPPGVFHLRSFRWKDETFLNLFTDPFEYKFTAIEPLFNSLPDARFMLVGDSTERDADVYAALAKQYPDQIDHIYIRLATNDDETAKRIADVLRDIPTDRWTIIQCDLDSDSPHSP